MTCINYTYYSILTVQRCFHVPFCFWNRRSKGALTHCTQWPQGVFESVVGMAKSPEGNAWSCDAVSHEHKLTGCTCCSAVYLLLFVSVWSQFLCVNANCMGGCFYFRGVTFVIKMWYICIYICSNMLYPHHKTTQETSYYKKTLITTNN